ncbi:MAG: tyrosine-type recombinase/integrase [Candidatus Bathyarchaeia archaeon]
MVSADQPHQPPTRPCPECGSQRLWKDGIRHTRSGNVQRYICRECGYRFSDRPDPPEHVERVHTKKSYRPSGYILDRRVSVALAEGTKNLAEVESRQKRAAGATKLSEADVKGLIAQYAYWLEKEGYKSATYLRLIRILAKKANLLDPEDVKSAIAKLPWKDGSKMLAVYAYDAMTNILKMSWTPPKYKQEEILPFIPEEKELDQLIASCKSRRMATFLQTLKETFADPGEALKLRWIDVDASNNVITISPVKGHNPRRLKVSSKLIAMLDSLPKTSERIFPTTYRTMAGCFEIVKRRASENLKNPRLRSITFSTFRHWGATMTYHYTKNILLVRKLLGHKRIQSTLKYTQLVHFKDDEFDVATATTVDEAKELLAAGFDYITEKNNIMLFRRPKRFGV